MEGYFPVELIIQIFNHLPIKCLLKCTSVCKSWNSLIKSSNFISTHLAINRNNQLPLLLVVHIPYCSKPQFSLRFDNDEFSEYKSLPLHVPFNNTTWHCFVGSCNGIVCYTCKPYKFQVILWNPFIRKSLTLPQYNFNSKALIGFDFDSCSNDYKVLRMVFHLSVNIEQGPRTEEAELYSLNTNCWKNITHIAPTYERIGQWVGAFVKGSLHWIVSCRTRNDGIKNLVMVFDVRNEVFSQIMLPEFLVKVNPIELSVIAFAELSIAVVKRENRAGTYYSHIWVMKEYGVVGSWKRLTTVGKRSKGMSTVLGFRNNGEVLVKFLGSGQIVSFDVDNKRYKTLITHQRSGDSSVCTHVESLVLLDKRNDAVNTISKRIDAGDLVDLLHPSDTKQSRRCYFL